METKTAKYLEADAQHKLLVISEKWRNKTDYTPNEILDCFDFLSAKIVAGNYIDVERSTDELVYYKNIDWGLKYIQRNGYTDEYQVNLFWLIRMIENWHDSRSLLYYYKFSPSFLKVLDPIHVAKAKSLCKSSYGEDVVALVRNALHQAPIVDVKKIG